LDREDAELIAGCLNGENAAAAVLDGWLSAASAPFRRRLGAEGEDLLQEVRLEALRLLRDGRFRGESRLKTYLWRAAVCTCIDALRRRRRRELAFAQDAGPEPPAADPSPLQLALSDEERRLRLAVLESMPAECRELWRMILAGLGYRDIAGRTGVTEATLRVRAHRCRKRAVEALDASAGGR
jgi:RNA polymerase sigma-70 factor (ECF subfamily)